MSDESPKPASRRKLLLYAAGGVVTTAAAGTLGFLGWRDKKLGAIAPAVTDDRPGVLVPGAKVTERRRLGRTNLEVGVVGIGAGGLGDNAGEAISRAVEMGMTYIDTATCYNRSEDTIGRVLSGDRALRDKLVIATKWDPGVKTTKAEMLESLDRSLKRMGISHVDVMQVHWLGGGHTRPDDGFNRLANPDLYEAMAEAKRAGKVRFFGATSHDGNRGKILETAIDKGFDVLLVKMNVLDHEGAGIPSLLAKAKAKDVGVVVMKSQPGGGRVPLGFEKSRMSIFQANLKWCLAQDGVHCVVHSSIGNDLHAQDLAASATQDKLGALDRALLDAYASALSPAYCRECAGGCTDACPSGVAIPHVAHALLYERDLGWHDAARDAYDGLSRAERYSSSCASCTRCTEACPHGVDARAIVREARERLG